MTRFLVIAVALALVVGQASAYYITNTYSGTFANDGYVPDNDLNGWADTHNLTSYSGATVLDVSVTLNITGGWNGDLYGYLVHVDENNNSSMVVLLNRVGQDFDNPYGFGNAGYNSVTLSDSVSLTSIQDVGSGTAEAALSGGPYNSAGGNLNTAFDTRTVNGTWSLFLADYSSGDISRITSWTLTIEAVPEPTTWAMIIFGAVMGGWHIVRRKQSV